jgi:hypothetical protein
MSGESAPEETGALLPAELDLLAAIGRGNEWLRAVLCTLARRGVAYRQARPEATQQLLAALSRWPIYKAGQFFFDLMEWEDFMLDGPPPPLLPETLDAQSLQRLARLLREIQSFLDGAIDPAAWPELRATLSGALPADDALPPLEGGFYLYQDVALGALWSALPAVSALGGASDAGRPA